MVRLTRRTTLRASFAPVISSVRAAFAPFVSALFAGRNAWGREARGPVSAEQAERAIRGGVGYLKAQQQSDGSWPNPGHHHQHTAGPTALAAHALLTAGEPADSPVVVSALRFLERFSPEEIDGTYSV